MRELKPEIQANEEQFSNQLGNHHSDSNHLDFEDRRFYERNLKTYSPIPKNIVFLCIFLMISGTAFLIAGMVDYWDGDQSRGIGFIVLGCFLTIPGYFYGYQLYLAYTATSPDERQEILDEIPNYQ